MTTALILVDIQNDYFPGGKMELVGMEAVSERAARMLADFRDQGKPTFHIQHIFAPNAGAGFFEPDTEGVRIHESIKPLAGEAVISKQYPSSFRETSLEKDLAKANIRDLVICGAMSHMCIDATVRAAADLGFNCTVVQDACATRDLEFRDNPIKAADVHGSFMNALGFAYAKVIDFDSFNVSDN